MNKVLNLLYSEKYRPTKLKELIVPSRVMKKLSKGVHQHLLLVGAAGTGKTSTAKAMVNEFQMPYIYINASLDTSVDVIRSKITDFCSTVSIVDGPGAMKVVLLDEIDGVSDQFFKALRSTMERFAGNTRFIATCNYINKIPDPIQSRFEIIDYNFTAEDEPELKKKYIKRVYDICKAEDIKIDNYAIAELIKRKFPDLRSTLNVIQGYKAEGKRNITAEDVKKFHSIYKDVFELVFDNIDPVENYKLIVSNYSNKVDDVMAALGSDFVEYIVAEEEDAVKFIPNVIITVAEHQAQRVHVIDEVVSLLSLVYKLQTIIRGE